MSITHIRIGLDTNLNAFRLSETFFLIQIGNKVEMIITRYP